MARGTVAEVGSRGCGNGYRQTKRPGEKQEAERLEWIVVAFSRDHALKLTPMSSRFPIAQWRETISSDPIGDKTEMRRYAPDSIKFGDASQ